MPNYVQRGMGGATEQYAPIDEMINKQFIPSILGDASRIISKDEQDLYALPCRMGGLGVGNVGEAAQQQYADAVTATRFLTDSILGRQKWDSEKYSNTFTKITSEQKTKRQEVLDKKKKYLNESFVAFLPPAQKKACENAMDKKTHYFLTLPPSEAQGTYLAPEAFRDGVCTRYGRDPVSIPARCACREQPPLTLEHALTCATGGNVIGRHNMLRDELRHLAVTATAGSQWAVEKEVWITDNLKTDLQIRNIEGDGKVTQVDVRICHPAAQSYHGKSTETILSDAEKSKKLTYEATCRRRCEKFVPFIITTDGALGTEANMMISKLASATAEKLKMQKSTIVTWARSRIATALVRACSACIRGSRGRITVDANRAAANEGKERRDGRAKERSSAKQDVGRYRNLQQQPNPTSALQSRPMPPHHTLSTSHHQPRSSYHQYPSHQSSPFPPFTPPPGLPQPMGRFGII